MPPDRMALAALGPRVLGLAAERTAGTIPYLPTLEHTRRARNALGGTALVAPVQLVVVGDRGGPSPASRAIARERVRSPYLDLANYRNHLLRLGWTTADLDDGGSDALIDAVVVQGDPAEMAAGLDAQLAAGASHVGISAVGDNPVAVLATLAGPLGLRG